MSYSNYERLKDRFQDSEEQINNVVQTVMSLIMIITLFFLSVLSIAKAIKI